MLSDLVLLLCWYLTIASTFYNFFTMVVHVSIKSVFRRIVGARTPLGACDFRSGAITSSARVYVMSQNDRCRRQLALIGIWFVCQLHLKDRNIHWYGQGPPLKIVSDPSFQQYHSAATAQLPAWCCLSVCQLRSGQNLCSLPPFGDMSHFRVTFQSGLYCTEIFQVFCLTNNRSGTNPASIWTAR